MNSETMVRLAKKEDAEAVQQLTSFMWQIVLGVCGIHLAREDQREEAHNIFIRVFSSLQTFEYSSDPELQYYIWKIAYGHCMTFLKSKKHTNEMFALDEHDLVDEEDEFIITDAHYEMMLYEVEQLPLGYRTIFKLRVFEGMSYEEMAPLIGCTEINCRTQYHRAKNHIKANLLKKGFYNGTE